MTVGVPLTAGAEWSQMDGRRQSLLDRAERLAEVTIPSVCTQDEYDSQQDSLTNGVTSLGAQCATHLVNKLVMAMFSNSRPFFRLALAEQEMIALAEKVGMSVDALTDILAQSEREALLGLEMSGSRDVLFEVITHLVCVGNVMMDLSDTDQVSAWALKNYVVRRDRKGRVLCIIIKQCVRRDELDDKARAYLPDGPEDSEHEYYIRIKMFKGNMRSEHWLDDKVLPYKTFGGTWKPEECPYRPLTWRLPLGQHYGIGRVEEYFADIGTHETVAEAMSDGAVLAAQFRWLQNPGGITRPEDLQNAKNGDIIPGVEGDLALVFANIGQQLNTVLAIGQQFERRIGAGFLLNSAVTRDAERVTAEEIRIQALELEGTLGGVYSRLAKDIQQPLARWLLKKAGTSIKGTKITPVIITGLDALSRNAELERMVQFLNDVTLLSQIPPEQRIMLEEANIISDFAAGRGVNKSRYVASADVVAQRMDQLKQQQQQQIAAEQGVAA